MPLTLYSQTSALKCFQGMFISFPDAFPHIFPSSLTQHIQNTDAAMIQGGQDEHVKASKLVQAKLTTRTRDSLASPCSTPLAWYTGHLPIHRRARGSLHYPCLLHSLSP